MTARIIILCLVALVGGGCATASGTPPEPYQVFEGTIEGSGPITLITLPDGTARIAVNGLCDEDGSSSLTAFLDVPDTEFDSDTTIETGCVGDLEAKVDFEVSGRIDGDRATGSISQHIAWNDEFEEWEEDVGPSEWTADRKPDSSLPTTETFTFDTIDGRSLAAGSGAAWLIDDANLTRVGADTADVERVGHANFLTRLFVDDDAVWLVDDDAGELVRYDPDSGDEVARIGLDGYSSVALPRVAAGSDAVWVSDDADEVVWKIDPATNEVVDKIELPFDRIEGLVATDLAAWIVTVNKAKDTILVPLDSETAAIGDPITLPGEVDGFGLTAAAPDEAVIVELRAGEIVHIDTRTGEIAEWDPGDVGGVAAEGNSLWFLDVGEELPRTLTRRDARTGETLETVTVPAVGYRIAVNGDDIWIATVSEDTLTHVQYTSSEAP